MEDDQQPAKEREAILADIIQRVHFNKEPPVPIDDLWPDDAEPDANESHPRNRSKE